MTRSVPLDLSYLFDMAVVTTSSYSNGTVLTGSPGVKCDFEENGELSFFKNASYCGIAENANI